MIIIRRYCPELHPQTPAYWAPASAPGIDNEWLGHDPFPGLTVLFWQQNDALYAPPRVPAHVPLICVILCPQPRAPSSQSVQKYLSREHESVIKHIDTSPEGSVWLGEVDRRCPEFTLSRHDYLRWQRRMRMNTSVMNMESSPEAVAMGDSRTPDEGMEGPKTEEPLA